MRTPTMHELRHPTASIASDIVAKLGEPNNYIALSLSMGYAIPYRGDRILFVPGSEVRSKRNQIGRTTSATFKYTDGSQIRFKWSEANGSQYHAIAPK